MKNMVIDDRLLFFGSLFISLREDWQLGLRLKFESLRKELKADVKQLHDLYVSNLDVDTKANPRDFNRYIHSQKKDTRGILPLKRINGSGVAESIVSLWICSTKVNTSKSSSLP